MSTLNYTTVNHTTGLLAAVFMLAFIGVAQADDIGGPIDPEGNVPSFNAVGAVACFNDGNGKTDRLEASIRDHPSNPFVDGMQVTITAFKGGHAISATDTTQGDEAGSPVVELEGGEGVYHMIVNKTRPGRRDVDVVFHCLTASGIHTGTSITISHYQ
ncbi:MAG: hypothetical protein RQ714_04135 [Nitrosomonas sp.]|nr:hypothetical protein [Nitrosomonas sp.]